MLFRSPAKFTLLEGSMDRHLGDNVPREELQRGVAPKEIISRLAPQIDRYMKQRQKYLLYEP